MSKKDILFLCQYFYPDNNSSATLPFDTARFLVEAGYSVDVLCGYPKEYTEQSQIRKKETVDGVSIQRMRYIQMGRKRKMGRLVNYFSFTVAALLRVFKLRNYDCLITYSNPPVLPFIPALASLFFGTRFVFVAYDVYPEIAYASGMVRSGDLVDRLTRMINKVIYQRASRIVALTDEMRMYLMENRREVEKDRIKTIPNWAHEEMLSPSGNHSASINIPNSAFVISYIGNMGICQEMETLACGIECLRDRKDIQFQFVGHGNKVAYLRRRFAGISNVRFYDFLVGEALDDVMRNSSCFVVSLEKGIGGMCAPSKYYSYLLSGKPIIAIMEKESYLFEEVEKRKIGYGVEIGDTKHLVDVICGLANDIDAIHMMGRNAADLYWNQYSANCARERYSRLIDEVLNEENN